MTNGFSFSLWGVSVLLALGVTLSCKGRPSDSALESQAYAQTGKSAAKASTALVDWRMHYFDGPLITTSYSVPFMAFHKTDGDDSFRGYSRKIFDEQVKGVSAERYLTEVLKVPAATINQIKEVVDTRSGGEQLIWSAGELSVKKLWRGWAAFPPERRFWFTLDTAYNEIRVISIFHDLENSNDDVYHCYFQGKYRDHCSYSYDGD